MSLTLKEQQQISQHLVECMEREELHGVEAAKCLNMNPCYISMAKNIRSWHSMGDAPWLRLAEWFNSRLPIKDFIIPEGEKIYEPVPRKTGEKKDAEPLKATTGEEWKALQRREYNCDRKPRRKPEEVPATEPKPIKKDEDPLLPEIEPDEHSPEALFGRRRWTAADFDNITPEYLNHKEKEAEMMSVIGSSLEELVQKYISQPYADRKLKVSLDIEINLVINGQRVKVA